MRNSVSLSVYFLLVLRCDVKQLLIEKKTKSASGKMKLIPLIIWLTYLADIRAQKFRQEQFPFPPQFQTPNAGMFSSDSSLYLPPESHTPIPYFSLNKVNGLQYPLLPPTGTKAPAIYPPHFPLMISTTLVPNFDDDDDDEDRGRIRFSSTPQPNPQRYNQTDKQSEPSKEKRDMRPVPRTTFQQPMQNRNDIKFPFKPQAPASPSVTSPTSVNHQQPSNYQQAVSPTPATRRMIISSETQKSDVGFDQVRAASYLGPQFLPAGGGIYVSSTTEPAIPILRLSNEMDLDGSFSYEALGADQTHYVQHSRMENMGPDKTEQVVEGSYSYVGDNGQTYTVHYIADANGFRASGDHLPVPPPVPEIIQRAVQYNLAEEAKKPPHLRDNGSWQDNGNWQNYLRDNEISDNTKTQKFSLPPTRNLFTGRTPEAFSYSYSQGSNTGNNLVTAASTQTPIKTVDYTTEQPKPKPNNGPISPQITFLASQGAHVPSLNTVQDTISRMFTTDKSSMPQLVNYEAGVKEAEQDPNKGLWRWQYGYNANNLNQNPNKDTISRSFGEGDDIMINFGDMTPEQYTKMIHSQFEYTPESNSADQYKQNFHVNENQNVQVDNRYSNQHANEQQSFQNYEINKKTEPERNEQKQYQNYVQNANAKQEQSQYLADYNENQRNNNQTQYQSYFQPQQGHHAKTQLQDKPSNDHFTRNDNSQQSPSTITPSPQSENWYKQSYDPDEVQQSQSSALPIEESRKLISDSPKILTHKDFVYPSQTITQSYNFDEDTIYEPRKIKALNTEPALKATTHTVNRVSTNFQKNNDVTEGNWIKTENDAQQSTTQEPYISAVSSFKFSDFIVQEDKSDFKPIITSTSTEVPRFTDTTESIIEDILENNIFLKNLFNVEKTEMVSTPKSEVRTEKKYINEPQKILNIKIEAEPKADQVPKFFPYHPKLTNEVKIFKKKPMDISEIMSYVSMKNHFESSKMKPKNKPQSDFDHKNEERFIPIQQEENESIPEQKPTYKPSLEHQAELRGIIKNYKVLQRNNNANKYENRELSRELSPPPLKSPNLPPLGRAGPSMKSYLPPIFV